MMGSTWERTEGKGEPPKGRPAPQLVTMKGTMGTQKGGRKGKGFRLKGRRRPGRWQRLCWPTTDSWGTCSAVLLTSGDYCAQGMLVWILCKQTLPIVVLLTNPLRFGCLGSVGNCHHATLSCTSINTAQFQKACWLIYNNRKLPLQALLCSCA